MTEQTNLSMQQTNDDVQFFETQTEEDHFLVGFEESEAVPSAFDETTRQQEEAATSQQQSSATVVSAVSDMREKESESDQKTAEEVSSEVSFAQRNDEQQDLRKNAEDSVTLKFLGQQYFLPKNALEQTSQALGMETDLVIRTLQKGMNYDRLQQSIQNSREKQVLDFYAMQNNMTREQYIDTLLANRENILLQSELDKLRQQFPDAEESLLSELAGKNVREKMDRFQTAQTQAANYETQLRHEKWVEFFRRYPNERVENLPRTEMEALITKNKMTPIEAYEQIQRQKLQTALEQKNKEIQLLKQQLAVSEQNRKNRQKDIGSVKSDADVQKEDAFLSGFFGA